MTKAEGEYRVVTENNKQGLVNENGRIVIPTIYDALGWSNGSNKVHQDRIGFKKDGKWGLIGIENKTISQAKYAHLFPFSKSLLIAAKKERSHYNYGLIDINGKIKLGFRYAKLKPHNIWLIALQKNTYNFRYGLINEKGKVLISIKNDYVTNLSLDLFVVENDKKYDIYNSEGKKISSQSYDSVKMMIYPWMAVYKHGRLGVLHSNGLEIKKPFYKSYQVTENGIQLYPFARWRILTATNERINTLHYDELKTTHGPFLKASIYSKDMFINLYDSLLLERENMNIYPFKYGLAPFKQHGSYGMLDSSLKVRIEASYDTLIPQAKYVLAAHKKEGKHHWVLLDTLGKVINDHGYESIKTLGEGYMSVKKYGFWGVINRDGTEVIYCKYDQIYDLKGDKIHAQLYNQEGILNLEGKWVVLPNQVRLTLIDAYSYLENSPDGGYWIDFEGNILASTEKTLQLHPLGFKEIREDGLFRIRNKNGNLLANKWLTEITLLLEKQIYILQAPGKSAVLNKEGRFIIPFKNSFHKIDAFSNGYLRVIKDGKYGLIDLDGHLRIINRYDDLSISSEDMLAFKLIGSWGYLNANEQIKIQPKYEKALPFVNGLGIVSKGGKYGLVNCYGEEKQRCIFDSLIRIGQEGYISLQDGKYGLIDRSGQEQVRPKYNLLEHTRKGYIIVSRKGKKGLLKESGESTIPLIYDELIYDQFSGYFLAKEEVQAINFKGK